MNRHLAAGVALACLMTGAWAQTEVVTGPEIQAQWVGKEITGRAGTGARVVMTLNADGTAKLLLGSMPDTGTWRPWEQGYCAAWKGLRGGQEACLTVKRDGEKFNIYRADGTFNGTLEVK